MWIILQCLCIRWGSWIVCERTLPGLIHHIKAFQLIQYTSVGLSSSRSHSMILSWSTRLIIRTILHDWVALTRRRLGRQDYKLTCLLASVCLLTLLWRESILRDILSANLLASPTHLKLVADLASKLGQLEHLVIVKRALIVSIVATLHVVSQVFLFNIVLHHGSLSKFAIGVFGHHVE